MQTGALLERARRSAGITQQELADRAGTSRTAVSAYEHGRKSPSLTTLQRLLQATGFDIDVRPHPRYRTVTGRRGQQYVVPHDLPDLNAGRALATVELPLHLNWSQPGRRFRLADRHDRARVYAIVLREGSPEDIEAYVDGALLVDLWPELVLPTDLRSAWQPLIDRTAGTS
ncbi:helix-turn-helix domain-containing protein [Thalassiella azotivora]